MWEVSQAPYNRLTVLGGCMASKNIGFRIPEEILTEIEARVGIDGETRTEVVISLLRRGLAIDPPAPGLDLEARVMTLEKEVERLGSAIQRHTPTPNTVRQRHTETPNTAIQRQTATPNDVEQRHTETPYSAIQTPNKSVKQAPNTAIQSNQISDATLRRMAKKAGLTVGNYATRDGWVKQGTGNRAVWVKGEAIALPDPPGGLGEG